MVLEISFNRAGGDIQRNGRGNIKIVARAFIAHPRPAIPDSPVSEIGSRVVVARHPHRAAARLPLIAFRPSLAARISGRGYGVSTPLFLTAVRIVSRHETADTELSARCSHHNLAAGDQ